MAANRTASKSAAAFRTISEVSDELEVPQHVLRFWETKFAQVRPMKRGGGRRYYRPEDIELLRRIRDLLYSDGYTIKGVQKLLREGQVKPPAHEDAVAEQERAGAPPPVGGSALEPGTVAEGDAEPPMAEQPAQPRHPQTGRAEGPASRAATATPSGAGRPAGSQAPQPESTTAQPAVESDLSAEKREAIRSVLDELRAARAELKRRTGE
jgi:DNA-binding transcriptional MerR regulator